jgi:hypothetical protein
LDALKEVPEGSPPASSGYAAWAWSFPDGGMHIAPYCMVFDYYNEMPEAKILTQKEIEYVRTHQLSRWHEHINVPSELEAVQKLAKHMGTAPNPFAKNFWDVTKASPGDARTNPLLTSLMNDLAGEDILVTGFLLMLNSKNALTIQSEDISRLNKARVKSGKMPLQEFNKTFLTIPGHLKRYQGGHGSSETVRLHMVRGHYKVRKSGVYWWSPHPRGHGVPLTRTQYQVGVSRNGKK